MAHVNQAKKAALSPAIKALLNKYRVKGTISVRDHSTLVLTVSSGKIDFIGNYNQVCGDHLWLGNLPFQPATDNLSVNPYWAHEHFSGVAKEFVVGFFGRKKFAELGPRFGAEADAGGGRGEHHALARLDVGAVLDGAAQVLADEGDCLHHPDVGHRRGALVVRAGAGMGGLGALEVRDRGVGLGRVQQRVDAAGSGDRRGQTERQLGVAERDVGT